MQQHQPIMAVDALMPVFPQKNYAHRICSRQEEANGAPWESYLQCIVGCASSHLLASTVPHKVSETVLARESTLDKSLCHSRPV